MDRTDRMDRIHRCTDHHSTDLLNIRRHIGHLSPDYTAPRQRYTRPPDDQLCTLKQKQRISHRGYHVKTLGDLAKK